MAHKVSVTDFIKVGTGAALHFGFQPLDKVRLNPKCKECADRIEHKDSASDRRLDALHGMLTSGMCSYFDYKLNGVDGPILFYTTEHVPRSGEIALTLQILNVQKSIAEAILIQTIRSMLIDLGYENHSVRINSLGDSDSISRYIRELTNYMRKRIDDMPAPARELMKEHVFVALMHLIEKEHEFGMKSPSPLEFLTDPSRKHFREIIEYLDMSNIPYEIDPKLLGHFQCYSEALFAFDLHDDEETYGESPLYIRGGRYNAFISRMSKTEIPGAGAVIVLRDKKSPSRIPRSGRGKKPSVFVVQLGFGPKVKSLLLLDELRHAGIPVYQNIVSDSLNEQLLEAQAKEVRYAVILGQKEYVEGTVILRDLREQSQECIPYDSLTSHLKRSRA